MIRFQDTWIKDTGTSCVTWYKPLNVDLITQLLAVTKKPQPYLHLDLKTWVLRSHRFEQRWVLPLTTILFFIVIDFFQILPRSLGTHLKRFRKTKIYSRNRIPFLLSTYLVHFRKNNIFIAKSSVFMRVQKDRHSVLFWYYIYVLERRERIHTRKCDTNWKVMSVSKSYF